MEDVDKSNNGDLSEPNNDDLGKSNNKDLDKFDQLVKKNKDLGKDWYHGLYASGGGACLRMRLERK